jgi:hypothetical protein
MTTTRSVAAALLSLPLLLSLSAPAQAAPPVKYSASGSFAQSGGVLLGAVEGLDGNVHLVQLSAQQSEDGTFGDGYVDSYACPDGITEPYDEETDEELCEYVGYHELWSEDVTLTTGKKMESANINGMFDIVSWECSEDEEECWQTVLGSLWVDVDLTATAKAATYRQTERYRDPETKYSYMGRWTQKASPATVSGTVGGAELVDTWGYLGTFTFRSMEKI